MGASQHDFLNNAQRAKADEFYTTYEAIDAELKHYKTDLRDRHVICPCNDRPGKACSSNGSSTTWANTGWPP